MIFFEYIELLIFSIILITITISALFFSTIAYSKYNEMKKKYDLFMTGRDAESLEQFFLDLQADIDHLLEDNKKNKETIKKINRISMKSYQKLGIHKYDAFEEKTGKKSFAISMLDYTNTGFVATCQSVGMGTIIFIKEVDAGATSVKLGPEEEKALFIAMGQKEN